MTFSNLAKKVFPTQILIQLRDLKRAGLPLSEMPQLRDGLAHNIGACAQYRFSKPKRDDNPLNLFLTRSDLYASADNVFERASETPSAEEMLFLVYCAPGLGAPPVLSAFTRLQNVRFTNVRKALMIIQIAEQFCTQKRFFSALAFVDGWDFSEYAEKHGLPISKVQHDVKMAILQKVATHTFLTRDKVLEANAFAGHIPVAKDQRIKAVDQLRRRLHKLRDLMVAANCAAHMKMSHDDNAYATVETRTEIATTILSKYMRKGQMTERTLEFLIRMGFINEVALAKRLCDGKASIE